MDDPSDGEYSRAPELEDVVGLCRSLNRESVRYLLIGGWAMILHGAVRTTKDIDLLVEPSPENVQALRRALADLPDNAARELADDEVTRYGVVRVADAVVVGLMASACGVTFQEAVAQGATERILVEGVPIAAAGKELLVRTKQTARPSDAADVAFLRACSTRRTARADEPRERNEGRAPPGSKRRSTGDARSLGPTRARGSRGGDEITLTDTNTCRRQERALVEQLPGATGLECRAARVRPGLPDSPHPPRATPR